MSTRGCIARKTRDGFCGVYHHWDSYPSGLGVTLYKLYNEHFKRDLKEMLKYLIDRHPAGWSTINEKDFAQAPGFQEKGFKTAGPECYCHGGRCESRCKITQDNASSSGCEFAYVFEDNKMFILSSYCKSGGKMIGAFGCGDPNASWKCIGEVDLNGMEPDWKKIGKG